MAATASVYGLRPVKRLGETYHGHGFNQFPIASGYATDLKVGDIMLLVTDGTVAKDTGTTTATPIGVFMGVSYTDSNLGFIQKQQWVASTVASDAMAYVCDDPDMIFQIQADGAVTRAAVGANAAVVQGSGNLTLGRSGVALQASSIATTATLPLKIIGFPDIEGFSAVGDAFTDCYVIWNAGMHEYRVAAGV